MKKYLFGIFALALAIGFTAFTTIKSESNGGAQTPMYWYEVDPTSQVILQFTEPVYDERANVEGFCANGDDIVCLRGFFNEQDTESGPVTISGDEEIETHD